MGDFRASCQIKLELRGKKHELNLGWVNWYDDGYGAPRAVVEFFEKAWAEAHDDFQREVAAAEEEAQKPAIEQKERDELARLKAKYEMP